MKTLNIFISSPGDVVAERTVAKRVIRKLQKEFGKHVELKALLWEDMPLQSTRSFQEGINQIVDANLIDIAIFILWSRLGSPLGTKFCRPDGTPYLSGTEYEYEMMMAANRQCGKPEILAYIKNAPATRILAEMHDLAAVEEWTEQNKRVQNFIKEYFYDKTSNTVYGAYHQFEESAAFEKKLTEHLRRLIADKIGEAGKIEWDRNPYVGLRPFEADDETIFYGRKRVVNEVEELLLRAYNAKGAPSLFVLGESGSGKSSVVKAGILPDFCEGGILPGTQWDIRQVTPGQFGGNPFSGILKLLASAIPSLESSRMWNDLQTGTDASHLYLADLIPPPSAKGVRQELLLFFDQFEELFTDPSITENMRQKTIELLEGLVSSRKIWFIFSMRNDFYHKFSGYPRLLELKKNSIAYDLPPMYPSELQEIVEEPAKKAGLTWELDNRSGNSLKTTIVNDIGIHSANLPLIEFALFELYDRKSSNNELTFAAYEEIGRIEGAIVQHADRLHDGLTDKEKMLFGNILSATITESPDNKGVYVRRMAYWDDIAKNEEVQQLLVRLVDAHILVSGKDMQNRPTLAIVHEILLTSWQVIKEWIEKEKHFIAQNNFYENCGTHWQETGKRRASLIKGQEAIRQAEYFLLHWEKFASKMSLEYIECSIRAFHGRHKAAYIGIFAFLLFSLASLYTLLATQHGSLSATLGQDFNGWDIVPFYSILTLFLAYKIWQKHMASPVFKTIRTSLFLSGILGTASLAAIIHTTQSASEYIRQDGFSASMTLALPLFFYAAVLLDFLQTLSDHLAIRTWEKRKFAMPFFFKRSFRKFTSIASYALFVLVGIAFFGISGKTLDEKTTKLENANKLIDELFENLNNIQSKLSPSDNFFINQRRLDYLWENYEYELTDTLVGWRDYQYALCQYNLGHPEQVPGNLRPAYFADARLGILAYAELGQTDSARQLIRQYKRGLENTEHASGVFDEEMAWTAQKLGEFKLIENIFTDTTNAHLANGNMRICQAHSHLMAGHTGKAIGIYKEQINEHPRWKDKIAQDFSALRWHGCTDEAILAVEKELALPRLEVRTTPADDENTREMAAPYAGKWLCEEKGSLLEWEITTDKQCFHVRTNLQGYELAAKATRFRMKKDKEKTILEEYHARRDKVTAYSLSLAGNDELHVNNLEKGETLIYHRKK